VILQRMNEADRLQAVLERGVEREPQELGVTGRHCVCVRRAVDEVVGEIGT
jgi:hypothetical protein